MLLHVAANRILLTLSQKPLSLVRDPDNCGLVYDDEEHREWMRTNLMVSEKIPYENLRMIAGNDPENLAPVVCYLNSVVAHAKIGGHTGITFLLDTASQFPGIRLVMHRDAAEEYDNIAPIKTLTHHLGKFNSWLANNWTMDWKGRLSHDDVPIMYGNWFYNITDDGDWGLAENLVWAVVYNEYRKNYHPTLVGDYNFDLPEIELDRNKLCDTAYRYDAISAALQGLVSSDGTTNRQVCVVPEVENILMNTVGISLPGKGSPEF